MKHFILVSFFYVGIIFAQHGAKSKSIQFSSAIPLKATVLNTEKLVKGSPISFFIDTTGDLFITLTGRYRRQKEFGGVAGNRKQSWLAYYDNSFKTPWDLKEFYLSQLGNPKGFFKEFTKNVDVEEFVKYKDSVIKLSPQGEKNVLFEGFNSLGEGPAAGIVKLGKKVLITSIPNLWKFDYNKKKEKLSNQTLVQDGFGVHLGWTGHDLHGLILGPDGRVYFTTADKGSFFTTKEGKKINLPHTGAVFRMEQDGSNLEVFATGLRNPQELTFDNYGNLFTGDNNGDSGDKARLVYLLEGSNSGWHFTFQSLKKKYLWVGENTERGWEHHNNGKDYMRAARILPPTGEFGWGPSGISYYPGLGLGPEYKNTFFLANYPKEIRAGKVKKQGASFVLDKDWSFIKGRNFSDVDFGYDSSLYALDWGIVWKISDKGRIMRYEAKNLSKKEKEAIAQVKNIFKNGLEKSKNFELLSYLGHEHKKLREASLHELVKRNAYNDLVSLIKNIASNEMAKINALWGIERIARKKNNSKLIDIAKNLFKDTSFQVRAQAIKVFGEAKNSSQNGYLKKILINSNDDAIVLYQAATTLGKTADKTGVKSIIKAIDKNNDQDIALRHGLVYALYNIERVSSGQLKKYYSSSSSSVRLALVLALRYLEHKDLTNFLNDKNIQVQAEAIRGIYQTRVGLAKLAEKLKSLDKKVLDFKPLFLRVLYANLILGKKEQANNLVDFLVSNWIEDKYKFQALDVLKQWLGDFSVVESMSNVRWGKSAREPLFGFTIKNPNPKDLLIVLKANKKILGKVSKALSIFLKPFYDREYFENEKNLREELSRGKYPLSILSSFVKKYSTYKQIEIYQFAYNSKNIENKVFAGIELINLDWDKYADDIIDKFVVDVKNLQLFIRGLKAYNKNFYVKIFEKLLDRENLSKEVFLDILSYRAVKKSLKYKAIVKKYLSKPEEEKLKMITLYGGNARNGKNIFENHPLGQCLRCHAIKGKGGSVGPDLGKIAKFKSREYLLEAMVYPNRHFAKGYANENIQLKDGKTISGLLEKEDKNKLVVKSYSNNKLVTIKKLHIHKRTEKISAMPSMKNQLSDSEIRDVIEYLSTLK